MVFKFILFWKLHYTEEFKTYIKSFVAFLVWFLESLPYFNCFPFHFIMLFNYDFFFLYHYFSFFDKNFNLSVYMFFAKASFLFSSLILFTILIVLFNFFLPYFNFVFPPYFNYLFLLLKISSLLKNIQFQLYIYFKYLKNSCKIMNFH